MEPWHAIRGMWLKSDFLSYFFPIHKTGPQNWIEVARLCQQAPETTCATLGVVMPICQCQYLCKVKAGLSPGTTFIRGDDDGDDFAVSIQQNRDTANLGAVWIYNKWSWPPVNWESLSNYFWTGNWPLIDVLLAGWEEWINIHCKGFELKANREARDVIGLLCKSIRGIFEKMIWDLHKDFMQRSRRFVPPTTTNS